MRGSLTTSPFQESAVVVGRDGEVEKLVALACIPVLVGASTFVVGSGTAAATALGAEVG